MDRTDRLNEILAGKIWRNNDKALLNVLAESAQDIASPDKIFFWGHSCLVFDVHYVTRIQARIHNGCCYCLREMDLMTFKTNDWTVFRKGTPSDIVVRYVYEVGGYRKYAEYTQ